MNENRRDFFRTAGTGLAAAAGALLSPAELLAQSAAWSEKDKLARIAGCSWPIRSIFKTRQGGRGGGNPQTAELKKKYGEITMLDFPQFTKDTFPGVTRMDIFSGLFGDVTDDSMFPEGRGFDPMSPSGRKWLDQLANKLVTTGTQVQHVSNNAPTNLASPDDALRKAGVDTAKRWLEGCKVLGVRSMRMNSPQALGPSIRPNALTSQEQ